MALVKTKVSTVVSKQLPEFVREDNAQFVAFLEAYYEFLEQSNKRNLESLRDIDDTVDSFVQYFKDELLPQLPQSVLSDKRYLAKQIKEVYRSKGTIKSYEFLFRLLFNETPDLYFPKVDMLRLSDGKWDQSNVIRTTEITGEAFNLVGQTITQGTTRASVESVIKFQVGILNIVQLTLNEASIVGTFNITDNISGFDNTNNSLITLDVIPVVTRFNVVQPGSYYSVGAPINLISGTGSDVKAEVQNIGYGSVTDIIIDTPGSGYSIGTELLFNNADAGDTGDSLISARAIITDTDLDSLLMEDGSYLLKEDLSQLDIESATTGGIRGIQLITGGAYYRKLPIITTTGGTGAKLLAIGNDIGRVTKVGITNPGTGYETPPVATFPNNIVVKHITGSFSVGDTITSLPQTLALETDITSELILETGDRIVLENQQVPSATLLSFDTDRNLMTLYPCSDRIVLVQENGDALLDEEGKYFVNEISGEFQINQTIRNSSGATAKIVSDASKSHGEARAVIGAVGKTLGRFVNADGKISESSKKIQDSLYYQEYSYVIKVGQSIDKYREAVKKLLHPIGLALFGEVRIQSFAKTPALLPLSIVEIQKFLRKFINMKMRAVGNYRTAFETHPDRDKEEITLIITDFMRAHLAVISAPSEFLPVIHIPYLTPQEIHLLDLRTEVGESLYTIYWKTFNEALPSFAGKELKLVIQGIQSEATVPVGPTLGWLEKWKFTIPPYVAGTKESIGVYREAWDQQSRWYHPDDAAVREWDQTYLGTSNAGYWNTYASTQIKDFGDVIIGDVINNPNTRSNYCKEAYIDIIRTSSYSYADTTIIYADDTEHTADMV
jgi:hypothetical protein